MTRQAIETRTRLLIIQDILDRVLAADSPLGSHHGRVLDAYHAVKRAAASLEQLND